MADPTREPDVRDYLRMVWRRRRAVAGVMGVAVVASIGASFASQPTYEASATLVLQDQSNVPSPKPPSP